MMSVVFCHSEIVMFQTSFTGFGPLSSSMQGKKSTVKVAMYNAGPAERFLSHRDFTLIHLLKPPGLLSNTYFEACEIVKFSKITGTSPGSPPRSAGPVHIGNSKSLHSQARRNGGTTRTSPGEFF